jgi:guanylate kinase
MRKGQLYIIAAPSGAGKTSLVSALLESLPELQVSISHTTREKRPNEQDGVNYFFVDEQTFMQKKASGDFLESANVFGNFYGTCKKWVQEALNQGIDVILEIDWQGARIVRDSMPDTIGIFVLPPSMQALRERLSARAEDDQAVIDARMQAATEEISHHDEFDYLVVNDDFEQALQELSAVILANRLKSEHQEAKYRDLLRDLLH